MADGSHAPAMRTYSAADLFCGAGGMSTGAIRAARAMDAKIRLTAVNHWSVAIDTHTRNHPTQRHWCADLETARPIELVPEGKLDILMASPTCTFHSRARGGKPVHDQQRMDPWHVVRWCTELRVKRILIENVPEFVDWGPCSLVTGRPIASRKGEYFRAWCEALRAIGFRIDYRVLCCADMGDPTSRRRFFLIGRSDGKRLRWPETTHAKGGATDLLGIRERWRGADRNVIDWSIRSRSIFGRKKPLVPNTIKRILAGAIRERWPQPHIDALQALLDGREPVLNVPANDATPFLIHFRGTHEHAIRGSAKGIDEPIPALTAGGGHVGLIMATGAGGAARALDQPVPTLTGGGQGGLAPHFITPIIVNRCNTDGGRTTRPVDEPCPTIATRGAGYLAEPLLMGVCGSALAKPVSEPTSTITTGGNGKGNGRPQLIEALVAPYYGSGSGESSQPASEPLPSVTTKSRFGLVNAVLIQTDQTGAKGTCVKPIDQPVGAIVSKANLGLAQPFLQHCTHHGERRTHSIDEPLPTVTAANRGELALAEPVLDGCRIDIHYRMLKWRELARAMSFEDEGEVYEFAGNETEITKQIGNAVPVRTAKALVRALLEEV